MAKMSPGRSLRRAAWPAALLLVFTAVAAASGCGNGATASTGMGGGGSGAGAGPTGGNGGTECVGVTVPEEAYDRDPGPLLAGMGGGGAGGGAGGAGGGTGGAPPSPTTLGELTPTYWLDDIQPLSCAYGATYGLEAFRGAVTVVGLWAGW